MWRRRITRINLLVGYFVGKIVRYYYAQWEGKLKIFYVETFMGLRANKLHDIFYEIYWPGWTLNGFNFTIICYNSFTVVKGSEK